MRTLNISVVMCAMFGTIPANAQWSDVNLTTPAGYSTSVFDGQPASATNPDVLVSGCNADFSLCATSGIGIQNFAQASAVNTGFAAANAQITTLNAALLSTNATATSLQSQFNNFQTFMSAQSVALGARIETAQELAIISAAMRDAIPNQGDRFAIRLNMAASEGIVAGSVGVAANITNSLRASFDYGRSENQTIVSGGLNLSFR